MYMYTQIHVQVPTGTQIYKHNYYIHFQSVIHYRVTCTTCTCRCFTLTARVTCFELTGIEVVFVGDPENGGQDLKDIEWMENLLYEEDMVGLHWDINGVSTMVDQSGGKEGRRG
jgi:hypothetical protein